MEAYQKMFEVLKLNMLHTGPRISDSARRKASIALSHDRKLARILIDVSKIHQELEDYLSTK